MNVKVSDIMNTKPISIKPYINVKEAAKIMREKDVGSLIIENNNFLLGILTEQGIVHKIVSRGKNPEEILVEDIMKSKIVTINPNDNIDYAMSLMLTRNIRQLPVVDEDNKLVGIITRNDIVKVQPAILNILHERKNIDDSYDITLKEKLKEINDYDLE